MTELMRRRRALMAAQGAEQQWEKVDYPLSNFNSFTVGTTATVSGNAIRVKDSQSGQYKCAYGAFATESGYEYKCLCTVNVASGVGRIVTRNANNNIVGLDTGALTGTGNTVEKIFQHNSTIAKFSLFSTFSTSAKGDVTYDGFEIYRRPV